MSVSLSPNLCILSLFSCTIKTEKIMTNCCKQKEKYNKIRDSFFYMCGKQTRNST